MAFWTSAAAGAIAIVAALSTGMPVYLAGALPWFTKAIFWRSQLSLTDFADVLVRRVNVCVIGVLLVAIVTASAADMGTTWRAAASLALSAAVVVFALQLSRECSAY